MSKRQTIVLACCIGAALAIDAGLLIVYGLHRQQSTLLTAIILNIGISCVIAGVLVAERKTKAS
jgi:hypothetical protein